jgi:hypothetical protein
MIYILEYVAVISSHAGSDVPQGSLLQSATASPKHISPHAYYRFLLSHLVVLITSTFLARDITYKAPHHTLSSVFCYVIPLRFRYPLQHPLLKRHQLMLSP